MFKADVCIRHGDISMLLDCEFISRKLVDIMAYTNRGIFVYLFLLVIAYV